LTAVSAIVFFLGLLFGFQRPSRLLLPRLLCYRASSLHPVQPGGCILYFEAAFLSSGRCRFVFTASPHRSSWRGARNLLHFRVSCQLASSTLSSASLRLSSLRGEAASTTAALGVNFALRLRISSFTASVRSSWPPVRPCFPSEGRGFYRLALGGVNRSFPPVDSARHPLFSAALAEFPVSMTTFGTCQLHRPVLSGLTNRCNHHLVRRCWPSVLLLIKRATPLR
jgi:hypothetical protein